MEVRIQWKKREDESIGKCLVQEVWSKMLSMEPEHPTEPTVKDTGETSTIILRNNKKDNDDSSYESSYNQL